MRKMSLKGINCWKAKLVGKFSLVGCLISKERNCGFHQWASDTLRSNYLRCVDCSKRIHQKAERQTRHQKRRGILNSDWRASKFEAPRQPMRMRPFRLEPVLNTDSKRK